MCHGCPNAPYTLYYSCYMYIHARPHMCAVFFHARPPLLGSFTHTLSGDTEDTGTLTVTIEDPAPGRMAIYTDHGTTAVASGVAAAVAAAIGTSPSSSSPADIGNAAAPSTGGESRPSSMRFMIGPGGGVVEARPKSIGSYTAGGNDENGYSGDGFNLGAAATGAVAPPLPSHIADILMRDPLAELSGADKAALWGSRYLRTGHARALPKVIKCVFLCSTRGHYECN